VRLDDYVAFLGGQEAVFGNVDFWTTQIVPYDFVTSGSGTVSTQDQQDCIAAMAAIAARTGLFFRAGGAHDPDRIRFQSSNGNNSPVGRQGGTQIINLFNFNTPFVVIHEIYHSLGFWHQQSASNRDTYITINYASICTSAMCCGTSDCSTGCAHNFDIVGGASIYGEYDFDSFMHYDRLAFSDGRCQDTITVNQPWNAQWQNAIGQRNHFSHWDALVCRGIYPYTLDYWWQAGASGSGNLVNPIGGSLTNRMATLPPTSVLFIKQSGNYSAVGVFSNPITIEAPLGATLGS